MNEIIRKLKYLVHTMQMGVDNLQDIVSKELTDLVHYIGFKNCEVKFIKLESLK